MKLLTLMCVAVALSGCATYDMYRDAVRAKIADGYDRALRLSQRIQCEDISIGAWRRKYGSNPELADAWRKLCDSAGEALPMNPEQ